MSPPGRPKGESPSAEHEGKPVDPPGRPNGESPTAPRHGSPASDFALACAPMTAATRDAARDLIGAFLDDDAHYRASAAAYGDDGEAALGRALELFLARPEVGFVWLAQVPAGGTATAVGACVVCRAISTSRGTLVAKLDDVTVHPQWQGRGVGGRMLAALCAHLVAEGMTRIDCGCHRDNAGAWRFYERLGFRPLDEERLALLLPA